MDDYGSRYTGSTYDIRRRNIYTAVDTWASTPEYQRNLLDGRRRRDHHTKGGWVVFQGKRIRLSNDYVRNCTEITEWRPRSWDVHYSGGRVRHREDYSDDAYVSILPPWSLTWGGANDDTCNRCNTECLLRLNDGSVQMANNLLEARQTYNTLANYASIGARSLRAFRRGNFKAAFRALGLHKPSKFASRRWLEYVYGWSPLASDIYQAQELLKRQSDALVVKAVRSLNDSDRIESGPTPVDNNAALRYRNSSWRRDVKQIIIAGIESPSIVAAKQWGVFNPASILWEAVPFSFVIDWFMPIGNVLEAYTAHCGLKFLTGSRTVKINGILREERVRRDTTYELQSQRYRLQAMFTSRQALKSFPSPVAYTKSPFSSGHALNAIALVRSLLFH